MNLQNLQQENGMLSMIKKTQKTGYGDGNENGTTIKFETQVIKSIVLHLRNA